MRPALLAKAGVGWSGDGDERAAWFEHAEGLLEGVSAEGVQYEFVVVHDAVEITGAVVDDQIGAEAFDPVDVRGARCGGHGRTEMLGQLNRDGSQATGSGMDEDFLAAVEIGPFDQRLPGGQRNQGEGGRLLHGEPGRLERDVVLLIEISSAKAPIRSWSGRA